MSVLNLFAAGGIVTYPLLTFSLIAVTLISERLLFWWKVTQRQPPLVQKVLQLYLTQPLACLPQLQENSDLPIARIFLAALTLNQPTPEEFRLALETSSLAEMPMLKRFNTALETITAAAPLLGLLGTILGLIRTFASLKIGDLGATNVAGVTGGISEALVSTVMGLVVAITTLLFANLFRSFYLRQLAFIQEHGGQLELLHRRRFRLNL